MGAQRRHPRRAPRPTPESLRPTVLQSFRTPRATSNPYIVQLLAHLRSATEVRTFSWRRALLQRQDVFHLHWPEVVFSRAGRVRTVLYTVLFAIVLLRMRLSGTAIVRTAHNIEPHEGGSRLTRSVLALGDRWTTAWIRLNDYTHPPAGAPVLTILHGHYRDWFAPFPHPEPVPGRLLFFGQVRPYKGIDDLLRAFGEVPGERLELHVAGRPNRPEFADAVRRLAVEDPRVSLHLDFVDDETLSREVGEASLVVLPYQEMHNSGALLLALSLDRPVLVPRNAITDALAAEVGDEWVIRYDGPFAADALSLAVAATEHGAPVGRPDLSEREWSATVEGHLRAYREAVSLVGTRSRRGRTRRPASPDPA